MGIDLLRDRGVPDAFTRVRIILMNGVEAEALGSEGGPS
jgi:hypothetical protein